MTFRPMLAETCDDIAQLPLPGFLSPKLDGIRCVVLDGKALTRKLKPVPNRFIREYLEAHPELDGLDGELMVKGASNFNEVQSAVMSEDGEPDFVFWVFDSHKTLGEFSERYFQARIAVLSHVERVSGRLNDDTDFVFPNAGKVALLQHNTVTALAEVVRLEQEYLDLGYEGTMYRKPDGLYKCGRSTAKQAWLLKLKRFHDDEALIVGFEEQMENTNEAETNELGLSKRSTHKAGMKGKDTLGAFVVEWRGVRFNVGTGDGLTQERRREYWARKDELLGQLLKFKYFELSKDLVPRFPISLGVRDARDV